MIYDRGEYLKYLVYDLKSVIDRDDKENQDKLDILYDYFDNLQPYILQYHVDSCMYKEVSKPEFRDFIERRLTGELIGAIKLKKEEPIHQTILGHDNGYLFSAYVELHNDFIKDEN